MASIKFIYLCWDHVKVAGVVGLKLAFMEWFLYNLVILIKLYKIRYLSLDKVLLFPRNQAICVKNWKLWRVPAATKFNIFCWNFCTPFLLNSVFKRVVGIFLIFFRSWVINKSVKNECVETRSFFIFSNNPRSKQKKKKKSRTSFCRYW